MKCCSKCKKLKKLIAFNKDKTQRNGIYPSCKECRAAVFRVYRLINREKMITKGRQWRKNNVEHIRQYEKQRYSDPKRRRAQKVLLSYENEKWRKKYPQKHNFKGELRKYRMRANGGKVSWNEWQAIKREYGFRCAGCGKKKKLTMDHIIPITKKGKHILKNIQPLCRSCNASKGNKLDFNFQRA